MVEQNLATKYSPSMEYYLEAIANLSGERKVARVNQISQVLQVKMPSVTSALRRLCDKGLVQHGKYGYVELTLNSKDLAKETIRRCKILSRFFTQALGIDQETTEEDACKIDHVISM
ncbi:MAG: metal-dependent transcriptional regulator [Chloroflexota bacterium]|nr:metal-dependent transcriptional regulator [Chloroflexota bacterium]